MAVPAGGDPVAHFTLDIDAAVRPITGRLASGDQCWPFSGWVELAAVLHNALERGAAEETAGVGPT